MSIRLQTRVVRALVAGAIIASAIGGGMVQNAFAQSVTAKSAPCDPYEKYDCLESNLGTGFWNRLINYYKLEMGHDAPPADPSVPPSALRSADFPPAAMTTPPMPFTEWPNGGNPGIGVTTPNMVDSPFMNAISDTDAGKWMIDNHIQAYGWGNVGFNLSTNNTHGGNAPAAYDYTPNVPVLNQIVEYIERLPDTVQKEHNDWGFRLNLIYGEDYRYTTSYGLFSGQLMNKNFQNGFDAVMLYYDWFTPFVGQGLNIRVGRYIAIPDIEAQLAPNNYMYSHSITYAYDNYTNEGILGTLALDKNWQIQAGITAGTDTTLQHLWSTNTIQCSPLYPCAGGPNVNGRMVNGNYIPGTGTQSFKQDPGDMPSATYAVRWNADDGKTSFQFVGNGLNSGQWGYNNLQWHGATFYHTFDEHWHISTEFYNEYQKNVPNSANATVQALYGPNNPGGMPFSQYAYNQPNLAYCGNSTALTCRAMSNGWVTYINYQIDSMNNLSLRPEIYWDPQGQRTGAGNQGTPGAYGNGPAIGSGVVYRNLAFGWQHWFSPQIEVRPEVAWYSASAPVFNNGQTKYQTVVSGDVIWHW